MKIIITENKVERLKELVKDLGAKQVINLMGGWDTFCKVLNIEGPMDFLHLFDDLDVVQSEEKENWTLFRYKKGRNIMVYDRKNEKVLINYDEIWSFLSVKFGLNYSDIQSLTEEWLGEVYNLRGITTRWGR
jgi:hypothetical protein